MDEIPAIALAFAGNALHVFGVNTDAGNSGFHIFAVSSDKFGQRKQGTSTRYTQVGVFFFLNNADGHQLETLRFLDSDKIFWEMVKVL